jgi:hypothetical protein
MPLILHVRGFYSARKAVDTTTERNANAPGSSIDYISERRGCQSLLTVTTAVLAFPPDCYVLSIAATADCTIGNLSHGPVRHLQGGHG